MYLATSACSRGVRRGRACYQASFEESAATRLQGRVQRLNYEKGMSSWHSVINADRSSLEESELVGFAIETAGGGCCSDERMKHFTLRPFHYSL